jgi:hypothetical protein
MPGPERPTLYNSSTPASRASAAREQAPCSRLSWSGGLWGNSKTTCGNCGKGRNPPATIHVLDSSTISIISRRALRRPACAARAWRKPARPPAKTLLEKSLHFFRLTFGGHSKRPTSPSLAEIAGIRPVVGGTDGGSVSWAFLSLVTAARRPTFRPPTFLGWPND